MSTISAAPVTGTATDIAAVSSLKKTQDITKLKGEMMEQLIDSSAPQGGAPPDGATFSLRV